MKKVFTEPPDCVFPTSDNVDGNLVVAKGDFIIKSEGMRYMVIELLGVGTFGQVFRCVSNDGEEVAIKVVKSFNRFYQYEMNEVRILKKLKELRLNTYFVELYDAFVYKQHLCIVIELLGHSMYELSKILKFNGIELSSVRGVLRQVLEGLHELHSLGITHCDLKPENILVADFFMESVRIIDFGSSSTRPMSSSFYVQSRFYRAPEVILGIPYGSAVDVWSVGCIAYELYMGHPLFPGGSNKDQIHRIHEFLPGGLPLFMLEHGTHTHEYFEKENGFFARDNPAKVTVQTMRERIYARRPLSKEADLFIDFILQALDPSYLKRHAPHTLLKHEFFAYKKESDAPREEKLRTDGKKAQLSAVQNRKMSMFNYGYFDEENLLNARKGSVYDPNHENRNNRAL